MQNLFLTTILHIINTPFLPTDPVLELRTESALEPPTDRAPPD